MELLSASSLLPLDSNGECRLPTRRSPRPSPRALPRPPAPLAGLRSREGALGAFPSCCQEGAVLLSRAQLQGLGTRGGELGYPWQRHLPQVTSPLARLQRSLCPADLGAQARVP